MKAAAMALVLIVGAAVVLWFGNTLNSWVLGGLMGGLAALLLSIPISLTLFSFLSRRHDERLRAVEQEEVLLARSYDYEDVEEFSEAEVYTLPPQQEEWYEDVSSRRIPTARRLPAPIYPRLPAAGQSHASASTDSPMPRQQPKVPPAAHGKGAASQRLAPDRRPPQYPGFPGYQGNVTRHSLHQSAALRAARQEAVQQQQHDIEVLPSTTSHLKRMPSTRPALNPAEQAHRPAEPRTSRQLPPQTEYQRRPRRPVVDSTPAEPGYFAGPRQIGGPQTESMKGNSRYLQTGQFRQTRQTDPLAHNRPSDEDDFDLDMSTGSLRNPLVRRAPYMYEDDPLRQELAQQIDPPAVRRSSRYEDEESY